MTYFAELEDIQRAYQFRRDGYSWGNGESVPLYSHNDLVGVYNHGHLVFDWYRYDAHLGYRQSGSTMRLPEGATVMEWAQGEELPEFVVQVFEGDHLHSQVRIKAETWQTAHEIVQREYPGMVVSVHSPGVVREIANVTKWGE